MFAAVSKKFENGATLEPFVGYMNERVVVGVGGCSAIVIIIGAVVSPSTLSMSPTVGV